MAGEKVRVSQQESLIERRNTRRNGFLKVANLFFNGGIEAKVKEQNDRIESIKKKIEKLKEKSFSDLVGKLTAEGKTINIAAQQNNEALGKVEKTLQELAQSLNTAIEATELNIVERELKKIEAFIKRLNKAQEEAPSAEIEAKIDVLRTKKVIYLLGELYKIDTSKAAPDVKGKQLFLIQQIAKMQAANPSMSIEQLIQKKDFKDTLEHELTKFVTEYLEAKRQQENIEPEGLAKQKQEIAKEKKRYRRSAQLHALFEKIANIDFNNAEEKYSAADLEKFIKRLRAQYNEIQESSDEHIQAIRAGLETDKEKIEGMITELESLLGRYQENLKNISDINERRVKLKEAYTEIHSKILPAKPGGKGNVSEFLVKTDYEAQIGKRVELLQKEPEKMEFLKKFEEFSEAHMREYEQMRRTEREGSVEKRAAMARSFIKTRIMEEFGDTEKVRTLYGSSYRKMWAETSKSPREVNKEYIEEFQKQLILETEETFGLDDESIEQKTQQQIPELTKETYLRQKLNQEIVQLIKAHESSAELVWKYEREKEKQTAIDQAIKTDLIEATKSAGLHTDETQIQSRVEALFSDDTGGKIKPFELIPTPNGVAVVFNPEKMDDIKKLIFGENSQYSHPETMAFTLKNNDSFRNIVANELGQAEWNGKIMIMSSDSDEYTMMHEAQHAINKHLSSELLNEDSENKELNSAVEEIATRFSSGEVWRELAYPQDEKTTKINLSLLGLGYITTDAKIPPQDLTNLYNFVERAKDLVREEIKLFDNENEKSIDQNMYGEVISEILMSNISETGKFDIKAAYTELTKRFEDIFAKLPVYAEKSALTASDIYGMELDQTEQEKLTQSYKTLLDNPGFTFDLVGLKDIRGRANVARDAYMTGPGEPQTGIESFVGPAGVSTVGSILQDIPLVGTSLGERYAWKKGMNTGSTEYEVSDFWIPFFNKRNYKTRNRAFGGIWRKFKHIPFLGDPSEKVTKFGTSPKKFFNDLPPFGRGWEIILTDILATKYGKKVDKWFKDTFPGRNMNPIETTKMNSSELWKQMNEQANADLGEAGLGLSHEQILRILAHHPMLVVEYSSGQVKQEYTQANLDRKNEVGIHRGAMTQEVFERLDDSDLDSNMWNKYKKESIKLAEAMKEWYDPDENPYTMNDLIHAAHLCHDLGINSLNPNIVRNTYYAKQDKDDPDFHQVGDKMVSKYIWYSLEDPNKRGVVIDNKYFSLGAAHELMRRYHYSFLKDALLKELPEITPEMQFQNKFEFDVDKDKLKKINNSTHEIQIPEDHIKYILDRRSMGGGPLVLPSNIAGVNHSITNMKELVYYYFSNKEYTTPSGTTQPSQDWIDKEEFGMAIDHHGTYRLYEINYHKNVDGSDLLQEDHHHPGHFHKVGKKNPYNNPAALLSPYRNMIGGYEGNERLMKKFLEKTTAEFDGGVDAIEKGLKYSNEFIRRIAEVSQYERMSYYRKTFWGDTKLWVQRLGNVAMIGSLVAAGLTGAPIFASIILGTMAVRIPLVMWMSKIESTYGDRRKGALGLQGELSGMIGTYKEIMGKPISRLDEWAFDIMQSQNESKVEDLIKTGTPEGTYPGGDLAIKFANTLFGEKGLIGRMAGG